MFLQPDSSFPGFLAGGKLRELNRLATCNGWEYALREVIRDQSVVDSICNVRAADFQYLWNVPEDSHILDLGAGWGTVSVALARYYHRVIAVEPILERARFISLRATQMGLPIESICADFHSIPLTPGRFGAVMLNGGLPSPEPGTGAGKSQIRFLASLRDLLQPGGLLCVRARNRWGLSHLSGARRKASQQGAASEYLRSPRAFQRLFEAAGFGSIQVFHSWHGREEPTMLLPLESAGALIHFVRSCNLGNYGRSGQLKEFVLRVAARSGAWKQLAPDLLFLMAKN